MPKLRVLVEEFFHLEEHHKQGDIIEKDEGTASHLVASGKAELVEGAAEGAEQPSAAPAEQSEPSAPPATEPPAGDAPASPDTAGNTPPFDDPTEPKSPGDTFGAPGALPGDTFGGTVEAKEGQS